jgi:HDOD domain
MTTDFSSYSRIPSLPTIAVEALKLFSDPDSSNEQLVSIIRKDPAIVSKLLKAANSAKYGVRGEVTDMSRAVMLMGRATVAPQSILNTTETSGGVLLYRRLLPKSLRASTVLQHFEVSVTQPAFCLDWVN